MRAAQRICEAPHRTPVQVPCSESKVESHIISFRILHLKSGLLISKGCWMRQASRTHASRERADTSRDLYTLELLKEKNADSTLALQIILSAERDATGNIQNFENNFPELSGKSCRYLIYLILIIDQTI